MVVDNLALYMWYATFGLIGMLFYKKNKWKGLLIGLGIALVVITILALLMGG